MENVNVINNKTYNMAKCKSCGNNVGCACQLTNGLCVSCIYKQHSNPQPEATVQITTFIPELSIEKDNIVHINL